MSLNIFLSLGPAPFSFITVIPVPCTVKHTIISCVHEFAFRTKCRQMLWASKTKTLFFRMES